MLENNKLCSFHIVKMYFNGERPLIYQSSIDIFYHYFDF